MPTPILNLLRAMRGQPVLPCDRPKPARKPAALIDPAAMAAHGLALAEYRRRRRDGEPVEFADLWSRWHLWIATQAEFGGLS